MRIIYYIFVVRLKANKPAITGVFGGSGEGKSWAVLRIHEIIAKIYGINYIDFVDDANVFIPLEYPKKLDAILHDKRLKRLNIFTIHEAREVVKAQLYRRFLNSIIADANAETREIKRLAFFFVSQFIKDIDREIRSTLNYYIICDRPLFKKTRLYFHVIYKDDRDLEKPKLRKRLLSGMVIDSQGRRRIFTPSFFEISKPSREVIDKFKILDKASKTKILQKKLKKILDLMAAEYGDDSNVKIDAMVSHYIDNPQQIQYIGKWNGKRWKLKQNSKDMHDLSADEYKIFEKKMNDKIKNSKLFVRPEDQYHDSENEELKDEGVD